MPTCALLSVNAFELVCLTLIFVECTRNNISRIWFSIFCERILPSWRHSLDVLSVRFSFSLLLFGVWSPAHCSSFKLRAFIHGNWVTCPGHQCGPAKNRQANCVQWINEWHTEWKSRACPMPPLLARTICISFSCRRFRFTCFSRSFEAFREISLKIP